jgi:outer membrane protein assembly factor BamB
MRRNMCGRFHRAVASSGQLAVMLVVLTALPASGGQPKDSTRSMRQKLARLSQGQPKPVWQAVVRAQETDFINFVSNDAVLVGTLETAGRLWGLAPKEIMLLNAASGEKLWTFSRASLGYPQQLLATDPVILLQGSKKVAALNAKNGTAIWERPWAGGNSLLLAGGERVLLFSTKESSVSLSVVNVKDGSQQWSSTVDNLLLEKDTAPDVKTIGDTVLLIGSEVAAISAGGQSLWRKRVTDSGKTAAAIALGDELYFTDETSITKSDPATGNAIWHQDFPGNAVRRLSISSAGVVVLLREGGTQGAQDVIQTLDRTTGKPLWKFGLAAQAESAMTLREGQIYVTTASQLIAIDALKGSAVFKVAIPPNLQAQRLLDDNLRITDDAIFVGRETGVMAVEKQGGKIRYAQSVLEGASFTYDYSMHKLNRALESRVPLKKRDESRAEAVLSLSRANRQAQMEHQNAVNQFNSASLRVQTAWRNLSAYGNAAPNAAPNLVYASLSQYQAELSAVSAGEREERTAIMTAEVSQTFRSHVNSLQNDFYIRPRYQAGRGWSLVLVDLKTGQRAEILLSPDNDPLALAAPNFPAFSIDPSGKRIVSKGLGLNPARFETYEKRAFTPRRKKIFPNAESWIIPYPSVISFDLASLPFGQTPGDNNPSPKPLTPEKKQLNDQLIAAAFQCDLETVRKTLEAGADVNAVDEYGQTTLMLAAESLRIYNKTNIIETLLERGADISIRDPNGWTAADHYAILGYYPTTGAAQNGLDHLLKPQKGESEEE